ncbi:MAG TPA: DedA family protein [Thermoanaerobaculia bacterium]
MRWRIVVLDKILELLREIPPWLVVASACLLPAAETALMAGLVIPGELIAVGAGLLAAGGHVPVAAVAAAAVIGAVAGDAIGYVVGRHFRKLIANRLSKKHWTKAQDWLKRRGAPAVFFARFTAFVRSVMPAAAGAAKLPFPKFLLWSVPAGILWGTGSVLLGYYAGQQSASVLHWAGGVAIVLIAAFVVYTRLTRKKGKGHSRNRSAA